MPSADLGALRGSETKLLLLQYPSHRPKAKPYNDREFAKPTSLRLKPQTGLLELDVPIDTHDNYNTRKGSQYGNSLQQSRIIREGGTHGLAGGFNAGPAGRHTRDEAIARSATHVLGNDNDQDRLVTQTLGGKIVKPVAGDPVYMLGVFRDDELHLTHLDALVQVRPQLHHLDASDELERGIGAGGRVSKALPNGEVAETKLESKALDIKIKSSGDGSDINLNTNSKLLRAIQQEPWQKYRWEDEESPSSHARFMKHMHLSFPTGIDGAPDPAGVAKLDTAISNQDWLDKMSAPRIEHGKKGDRGLINKVRGRERERQRRKRNEEARRQRAREAKHAGPSTGAHGPFSVENNEEDSGELSELSDLSSIDLPEPKEGEAEDEEMADAELERTRASDEVSPTRARGRSKKTHNIITIDD